jgi:hypothetical protein
MKILNNTKSLVSSTKSLVSSKISNFNDFWKTELGTFIKKYFWFLIYFFIIFYIILSINTFTKLKTIYLELKIFFYLTLVFLFLIINDILETPYEKTKQFLIILILSLILIYGCTYLIIYYYKGNHRFWLCLFIAIIIIIISVIILYYAFYVKNYDEAINLFSSFKYSFLKNNNFIIFLVAILVLFKFIYSKFNWKTNLTDVLLPSVLGGLLIFFIFTLIIFLCLKLKIINKYQILNSFIAIGSICIFLLCIYLNFLMSSISQICLAPNYVPDSNNKESIIIFLFISLIIVLWLDDSRNWHQSGSIMFVFASIITFYVFFYYSMKYPDLGLLSFWLLVEWCILFTRRKENSKSAIHFSFMKV